MECRRKSQIIALAADKDVLSDFGASWPSKGRAADAGFVASLHEIGNLYLNGWGAPRDYQKARFNFERAIDGGGVHSYANLDNMYLRGQGVSMGKTKSLQDLSKGFDDR